ncbi:MAG: hypothetical protein WBC51_19215 [Vicinamibacterales bacterium]
MRTADRAWLRVTILFSVMTAVATWPQVLRPGDVPANQDSWLNLWRLSWIAYQLPRDPVHLFDTNIYFPERATLAYSDATLLQGLVAAPLFWLGVPTPYVYNLLVLGSFVFAGVAAWALVSQLTGSRRAGIIAGVIFAFTPYRFDHYMHLELLWTGWMPLTLLAVHRAIERGTVGSGIAVGLLFAAQGLSCIYYAVLFATVLAVFCAVLTVPMPRVRLARAAVSLGCGALVAATFLAPYLMPYRRARTTVGERSANDALLFGAGPTHYISATPSNLLYGSLTARLGRHEKRLFPGLIAIALAGTGLWPPLCRRRIAYLIALLLAIDLSFGPRGLSYDLFREYLLPYKGIRAIARAGSIALLMVAVLAGFGWARLEQMARLRERARTFAAFSVVIAAMMLEYATMPLKLIPAPRQPEPVYQWLAAKADGGAVLELPVPDIYTAPLMDPEFMYWSTFHWHPLVNGYSGNVPTSYLDLMRGMQTFPSDAEIERLRRMGVRYVVVHERFYGSNRYREVTAALDARSDVVKQQSFGHAGEEVTVYSPTAAVHD